MAIDEEGRPLPDNNESNQFEKETRMWTLEKLITEGGKVKWYKSHLWYGYHCTWVSPLGEEWEYTLPKMRKTSLWKVMWYNGNVRKFTRGNNYFLNKKTERKE